MTQVPTDEWLTVAQVVARHAVTERHVRRVIRTGDLPCERDNHRGDRRNASIRIKASEAARWPLRERQDTP